MMNQLFCYLACFFALIQSTAQNQPHNHWQLAGSVGYAASTQDKIVRNQDLVIENDTVVGFVPSTFRYGTSTGFNLDAEAIYLKTREASLDDSWQKNSNTFILKDGSSEIGAPLVFFSNGYYAWSTSFGYPIIDSFYSHLTTDARWMEIGHWRYDSIREIIDLVGYGVFMKWGMRLSYFAVSYEIEIDAVNEILKIKLIEPYPDINLKYNYNLDFEKVYEFEPYPYPPIEQLNNNPEFLNRIDTKYKELQKKSK